MGGEAVYSCACSEALLGKKSAPMTIQTAAIAIGYHKPTKGSPVGVAVVLDTSKRRVAISGVKPPKIPLPIW